MDTDTPPKAKTAQPSYRVYRLDAAYGCFALIFLTLIYGSLLWLLPISQGDREGYAMLLAIPMVLLGFAVGIVGLVLAIIHRSEWQLGFMAVVLVLFGATLFFDNEDNHGSGSNILCSDNRCFLRELVLLPPKKGEAGTTARIIGRSGHRAIGSAVRWKSVRKRGMNTFAPPKARMLRAIACVVQISSRFEGSRR